MRDINFSRDEQVLDYAQSQFAAELAAQHQRGQKIRKIMDCRRQLELRREAQQLARETSEFDFSGICEG